MQGTASNQTRFYWIFPAFCRFSGRRNRIEYAMALFFAGFEEMTTLRLREQAPERCDNRFCILGLEPDSQSAGYADTPGCRHHSDI